MRLALAEYFVTIKMQLICFNLWQLIEYSVFQVLIKGVYLNKWHKMHSSAFQN